MAMRIAERHGLHRLAICAMLVYARVHVDEADENDDEQQYHVQGAVVQQLLGECESNGWDNEAALCRKLISDIAKRTA